MRLKHKRTKACAISKKTKLKVYQRDNGLCIFCGAQGLPEAHVIPRSQGGLGCEANIITACRKCHDKLDNSPKRKEMLKTAIEYLKRFYPEWTKEDYIFDKWHKDKGQSDILIDKGSKNVTLLKSNTEKPLNDKAKPPQGFHFL